MPPARVDEVPVEPASPAPTPGPVRVLHLRNSDRLGGPERLILDQVARGGPGVEATIASFATGPGPHPFLDAARAAGLSTWRVEQSSSYDPRIVAQVRKAVEATRADVLVGHDYKANLVLVAASRGRAWKRAAVVHGYTAEDRKVRWFERLDRRVVRGMDAVVAVSSALRADLLGAGVAPDRLHLIENGIDVAGVQAAAASSRGALRRAWGIAEGERVVLTLGRLSPEKGHATLVDAFQHAALPNCRLVLVGDGPCEADLRAATASRGEGGVVFAGWRDDPWACLGAADVFVLPSLREGLPLAVLEALAAGVPVVASAVGGVPGALGHGTCGLLVPPSDVSALSRALTESLQGGAETGRRVKAGIAHVAARYTSSRQARALADLWVALHTAARRGG